MIETSAETKHINAALFTIRKMLTPIAKDGLNDRFQHKYATLNAVLATIDPLLEKEGILLTQYPIPGPASSVCRLGTRFTHVESGEYIEATMEIPLAKQDAHAMASAITYARRYALTTMLGIATEDDDGNKATPVDCRMRGKMWRALRDRYGENAEAMRQTMSDIIGRDIQKSTELTNDEVYEIVKALN